MTGLELGLLAGVAATLAASYYDQRKLKREHERELGGSAKRVEELGQALQLARDDADHLWEMAMGHKQALARQVAAASPTPHSPPPPPEQGEDEEPAITLSRPEAELVSGVLSHIHGVGENRDRADALVERLYRSHGVDWSQHQGVVEQRRNGGLAYA